MALIFQDHPPATIELLESGNVLLLLSETLQIFFCKVVESASVQQLISSTVRYRHF